MGNILVYYAEDFVECSVKSELSLLVNNTIRKTFADQIYYDDFVSIDKDKNGQITAITANTAKINEIAARLAYEIQVGINSMERITVKVPLGILFDKTILHAIGPRISVSVLQYGNIETEIQSGFSSEGINQIKHKIFLCIKENIIIKTALVKKKQSIVITVPFSESIIIGKVPSFYFSEK